MEPDTQEIILAGELFAIDDQALQVKSGRKGNKH